MSPVSCGGLAPAELTRVRYSESTTLRSSSTASGAPLDARSTNAPRPQKVAYEARLAPATLPAEGSARPLSAARVAAALATSHGALAPTGKSQLVGEKRMVRLSVVPPPPVAGRAAGRAVRTVIGATPSPPTPRRPRSPPRAQPGGRAPNLAATPPAWSSASHHMRAPSWAPRLARRAWCRETRARGRRGTRRRRRSPPGLRPRRPGQGGRSCAPPRPSPPAGRSCW